MPFLQRFSEILEHEGKAQPDLILVRRILLLWLVPALVLAGFFTYLVSKGIHPWEHVLHLPNGVTDDPMSGRGRVARCTFFAASNEHARLALSRANGRAELWDSQKLERIKILDLPESAEPVDPEMPYQNSPHHLHFDQRGHLFLWADPQGIFEFDLSGDLVASRQIDVPFIRTLSVSPQGNQLAYSLQAPELVTWPETEKIDLPVLKNLNSGSQRLEWLPDGRHFLFNDFLSVSLFDAREKKVVFQHFGLEEDLPEPQDADIPKRAWTGFHIDSRLVRNGKRFVTAYSGNDMFDVHPEYHAIRFYDTLTGRSLKTHSLPEAPRAISVSGRGLLAVGMVTDFRSLVYLFDTESMEKVKELDFKLTNFFPSRIQLAPDHQTLFAGSNRSWLVDLNQKAAPVKIFDHLSNTQKALFSSDGDTLLTMQMNLDFDVWKKRRELNALGAMIHWEYWAVHLVCLVGFLGITVQMARATSGLKKKRLPVALWLVLVATALGLSGRVAGLLLDPTLHGVWGEGETTSIGQMVFHSLICLLWLRILVGLARLEPLWRKTALILYFLGGLVLTGLFAWIIWLLLQVPTDLVVGKFQEFVFENGWKPGLSHVPYLVATIGIILLVFGIWWLLFLSSTRRLFVPDPTPDAPSGSG